MRYESVFFFGELAPAFLAILVLTFAWSLAFTRWPMAALLCALVKAGAFVLYFGVLFDGTYTLLDDLSYLAGGRKLLGALSPDSSLADVLKEAQRISASTHYSYYIQNALAIKLFGPHYFAPVSLNILLTLPIASLGATIARRNFGLGRDESRVLFYFLALHPDIFSWSQMLNLKDILALLCHGLMLLAVSMYLKGNWARAFALAALVSVLLFVTRFYSTLFFLFAIAFAVMFSREVRPKIKLTLGLVMLSGVVGLAILFSRYATIFWANFSNPVTGIPRALLTPVPFKIDPSYQFLLIASLWHWLMLPFLLLGLVIVRRYRTTFSLFLVVYFCTFIAFYGMFLELQGPRHRVQLDLAMGIFQFMGLRYFLLRRAGAEDGAKAPPAGTVAT